RDSSRRDSHARAAAAHRRLLSLGRVFTRHTSDFGEAIRMKLLAILSLIGAATMACSRPRAAETSSGAPPTVAVAKVTRGDLAQALTIPAAFRAFQEIEVHSKVAGYVKE